MTAPVAHIDDVPQTIFNILSTDPRTAAPALNWVYGRRTPDGLKAFPAGLVALGEGTDVVFSIPTSRKTDLTVMVFLRYRSETSVGDAELQMHTGLDSVLQVLYDNPSFGLNYVIKYSAHFKTDSNPQASPFTADTLINVAVDMTPR